MRILGIDYGDARVGVAVTDIMGFMANGVKTIKNKGKEKLMAELLLVINEYNPEKILTYLQTPIACPDLISEGQWLPSGEITFESYSGVIYLAFRYRGVYKDKRCTSFSLDNIKLQEKDE